MFVVSFPSPFLYAFATDSLLLVSGLPVAADAPGPSETLDLVNFASLLSSYCLPLVSLSLSAVSPLSLTSLYLRSYLSATTCATSRSFRHMLAFKFPCYCLETISLVWIECGWYNCCLGRHFHTFCLQCLPCVSGICLRRLSGRVLYLSLG